MSAVSRDKRVFVTSLSVAAGDLWLDGVILLLLAVCVWGVLGA